MFPFASLETAAERADDPEAAADHEPAVPSFADAPSATGPDADASPASDALEELGDRIATLAADIHAAMQRFLLLVAEFDRRRGWEVSGHRSCAHWLSWRTGIDLGTAREKVRTARKLAGLPETCEAMARGELSFSQVRALTRVATPDNEGTLLELAREASAAQLERMVRGWKRGNREEEAKRERRLHRSRFLSVFPDEEGMYLVRGKLPPEVGVLLMRAIEAAGDVLWREEGPGGGGESEGGGRGGGEYGGRRGGGYGWPADPEASERAAARRRADALGLLAERAMGAGLGADEIPLSGTRAERYQVVLHVEGKVDEDTWLEDGTRVSAETSRRLGCDAGRVRMTHGPDGGILSVGRRTRTIPPALRRALEARDRGCRFPGCGLRFTEGHHVKHWAEGGETSLDNCLLLCRHHHRLVHEEGWRVEWGGKGRPVFHSPRGEMRFEGGWRAPGSGGGVETPGVSGVRSIVAENRRCGVAPDPWTAAAPWDREGDIPDRVYFPAVEALGEAFG